MRTRPLLTGLFPLALVLLCFTTGALAEQRATVAITQFKLNGPSDMAYLKQGLRDMLGGRLTAEAGVAMAPGKAVDALIAEAGPELSPERAAQVAATLNADYLIFGSLTSLGGGLSVDARVFSVKAKSADRRIQPFYATAPTQAEMMRAIDKVSWDVLETVFGKPRPAAAAPQALAGAPAPSPFMTTHPDKTFMTSGGGYSAMGGRAFTKTRNMRMTLQALAVGDVDGDGNDDLVLAGESEFTVYQRSGTRLNQFAKLDLPARYRIHAVNVADLDGDGRGEIYVSAADHLTPGSRVVEWDGAQLVTILDEARWYIRPVRVPGMGLVLAGQRSGHGQSLGIGVHRLTQNGGALVAEEKLNLPGEANLFNFEYADLDGDDQSEVVLVDEFFKLRVYDQAGNMKYKSTDLFCGTKRFLGGAPPMKRTANPNAAVVVDGRGEINAEIPVPSRIIIADVDRDGISEVVVNRNPSSMINAMPRLMQFTHGTMVGLKWNGLALEEMWRTRQLDGYVVEFQEKSRHAKLEDGMIDELFIGVILRSNMLDAMFADESCVVIYPFEFQPVEAEKKE